MNQYCICIAVVRAYFSVRVWYYYIAGYIILHGHDIKTYIAWVSQVRYTLVPAPPHNSNLCTH